jgi:predicted dithiol-disulfide oxidoreductase (DUF899 family)
MMIPPKIMKNNTTTASPRIATPAEWLDARKALLVKEKELQRQHDAVAAARRTLPWVEVTQPYAFDGPAGRQTLAQLFGPRSQLIVYHFMFGPGWDEGCKSCSFCADHIGPMLPHLAARDISFAAISSAPLADFQPFKKRMGWDFNWVSSSQNSFNTDFHVTFTLEDMQQGRVNYNFVTHPPGLFPVEELPGISVFARQGDKVYHTYSAYSRGVEPILGTYQMIDLTPKGRNEDALEHSMAWVQYHDRYQENQAVNANQPYLPPRGSIFNPKAGGARAS